MLNEYDEWYCDHCGNPVDWCEIVVTRDGDEVCDTCYEEAV